MLDLSDFYRNPPHPQNPFGDDNATSGGLNRWQQPESFADYDDLDAVQEGYAPLQEDFFAWRRPEEDAQPPYGGEVLQGGVPLFGAGAEGDEPTRIGVPAVSPQMVSRRKTVDRGEAGAIEQAPVLQRPAETALKRRQMAEERQPQQPSFAPETPASPEASAPAGGRQRRAGRVARQQEEQGAEAAYAPTFAQPKEELPPRQFAQPKEELPPARQSFVASASFEEEIAPFPSFEEAKMERETPPARRPVQSGERYMGARTAMPQGGGAPAPRQRPEATEYAAGGSESVRGTVVPPRPKIEDSAGTPRGANGNAVQRPPAGRPPQGGRPQAPRPQGNRPPADQSNRFDNADEENRSFAPRPSRGTPAGRPGGQAPVKRKPYEFEEEEDEIEVRRSGFLVPLLVTLLIIGGLLAGICLPNWNAESGGVVGILGSAKQSIVGLFSSLKDGIFPDEEKITQFTVVPTDAIAPAELVFNIQTSTAVTDLRIVDDAGTVILEKTLTDADTLGGDVTKNSKGMIWMLRYTVTEGYQGRYTVQTPEKDGTWSEGVTLETDVNIAPPVEIAPPVQGFAINTTQGEVPLTADFTIETSVDVVEVRIVNDYGNTVASHLLDEAETENGRVMESADKNIWNMYVDVDEAYSGNYSLQYRLATDLAFMLSDESAYVEFMPEENESEAIPEEEEDEEEPAVIARAEAPVETPVPQATPEPTPAPTAAPAPEATPMPVLQAQADESAAPSVISLKETIYNADKTVKTYSRTKALSMRTPFRYALWLDSGVLTFRGGQFRQNAFHGTAVVDEETLEQIWKVDVGSTKLGKNTVSGIGWPGQPAIVKWPTEVRERMLIKDEKRSIPALKEVILSGQDGKIYFLDLTDGKETRDPIDMGAPSGGGVSVATSGAPILGVGQTYGNLANKQVDNGYHLYDLLTNKRALMLSSRDKAANSSFTGVTGAALFDKITGTMVVGSQNGLIYTAELGELKDTFDHVGVKLNIKNPAIQKYKTLASKQAKKSTNIDSSVAMYDHYVFYGDKTGILQCLDINTMTPVWGIKTGDSIDATPALEMDADGETLALYTANVIQLLGRKGSSTIRRIDAMTGKVEWEYEVPDLVYKAGYRIGCVASPVVGENAISDLVIFTASNGEAGATIIALKKSSGEVAWTKTLESESLSSPVAVYNEAGDAWLVQAESNGNVHLLDGKTGEVKNTLQLEGKIEASPAIYKNIMVIGTMGTDTSAIYGIQIQ